MINQALYGGVAQATYNMPPKMRYYDPSVPGDEANLAKAKQLLKASPVPSGFSATLILRLYYCFTSSLGRSFRPSGRRSV